jgi:hypothetical protein
VFLDHARFLLRGLVLPLAATALFACAKERPEKATVTVLMTASNVGEVGPCG